MKPLLIVLFLLLFVSCNSDTRRLEERIDSLEKKIDNLEKLVSNTYAPGLGDLMTAVQAHHSKLWFAGKENNWELARFEVKELQEILDDVVKYEKDRPETKYIGMMDAPLKKVRLAIKSKDSKKFQESYILLTKSCNDCHRVTRFEYNRVQIPDRSPFTNQDFKASNK